MLEYLVTSCVVSVIPMECVWLIANRYAKPEFL